MKKILLGLISILLFYTYITSSHAFTPYSISITSVPPAVATSSEFSKLNVKIGDYFTINTHITGSDVVNDALTWSWDSTKLNCSKYPEVDSPDIKCKVISNGTSDISVTSYPVLADGSKLTHTSNIITIVAQSTTSTYTPYSITITSNPPATVTSAEYSKVTAKISDVITITRHEKGSGIINGAFTWNWDKAKLNCAGYPDFDSEDLQCKVISSGSSDVSITTYPTFSDGTKATHTSNTITVVSGSTQPTSTAPVQCYARTVEGDGKYLIELKGGNDRTEACRFSKWHYDIISGQAKIIAQDQYTVTFDDSLKGTVKIVVAEPTPYESTFIIGSRYTGTTSSTEGPTVDKILDNTPIAGYEDEVLTAFDSSPFSDTDVNTASGRAAAELYRRGVIGGYADGEFKGSRPVNRAEAAKFLLLARYGTVDEVTNSGKFWDVLDGQWYTKFVITAANLGIINGYPDSSFKPANTVRTAEFVKMLAKTFGLPENLPYDFVDVQPTDWFAPYAGIAQKYDLFPNHKTKLLPQTLLARDEVAVAIYQYLKNR